MKPIYESALALAIGLGITVAVTGTFNAIINHSAKIYKTGETFSISRIDGPFSSTSYQQSKFGEETLVYISEAGPLTKNLFCRDGSFDNGTADGLCDTVCKQEWFKERICFERETDYDSHRGLFKEADKLQKDTKKRFAYSHF